MTTTSDQNIIHTLISAALEAAAGMTDPDPNLVAETAEHVLESLTSEQRQEAARCWVARVVSDAIRSNVAKIEHDTIRAASYRERRERHQPGHGTSYWIDRRCRCNKCVTTMRADSARQERLHARMTTIISDFRDELRAQWTTELLESGFALGDGTTVTWGQATVEQHQQRIALLTRNAKGNLQTAARHQAAIDDIHASGVNCLADRMRGAA